MDVKWKVVLVFFFVFVDIRSLEILEDRRFGWKRRGILGQEMGWTRVYISEGELE